MKIELRNIKHSALASEETHFYTATLYVDGEAFATVSNEGHGGPDLVVPLGGKTQQDIEALERKVQETYPKWGKEYGSAEDDMETTLEMVCCELVNDYLLKRDIKRALRRPVFIDPDRKGIQYFRLTHGWTLERALPVLRAKYPTYRFLNDMPEDEQMRVWREAA